MPLASRRPHQQHTTSGWDGDGYGGGSNDAPLPSSSRRASSDGLVIQQQQQQQQHLLPVTAQEGEQLRHRHSPTGSSSSSPTGRSPVDPAGSSQSAAAAAASAPCRRRKKGVHRTSSFGFRRRSLLFRFNAAARSTSLFLLPWRKFRCRMPVCLGVGAFLALVTLLVGGAIFPSMLEGEEGGGRVSRTYRPRDHRNNRHHHYLGRGRRRAALSASASYYDLRSSSFRITFLAWNSTSNEESKGDYLEGPRPTGDDNDSTEEAARKPYYGNLYVDVFEEEGMKRAIYHDFRLDRRKKDIEVKSKQVEAYYAFDDDVLRNPLREWDDDTIADKKRCRRTSWHRDLPIDCNSVHEMDLPTLTLGDRFGYLGEGGYRYVYTVRPEEGEAERRKTFVYKDFGIEANYNLADMEFQRMDSIVNERLSWSPLIVDVYGYCALSHIGEYMPDGTLETAAAPIGRHEVVLNDKEGLDPKNDILPSQKLRYALEMAEALLLLHSWPDGVMVHDDIQMTQYLFTPDGHLKLNDFNRAEIMLWNEKDQEYCRYINHPGHGDWRAPEEYFDYPLDEKIDIWSLGNNMYSVLTGVYPFYDTLETKEVQKKVKAGEVPYIDERWRTRSYAEGKLVELIERCYAFKPDERIDIFDTVRFLRDAVEENTRHHLHEDQEVAVAKERHHDKDNEERR